MTEVEKSASGGKVIDASVGAAAGVAGVKVNQGVQYMVCEKVHHRRTYDPGTGKQVQYDKMIEAEVTCGEPPKDFHRFQGIGTLKATLRQLEGAPPQEHVEQYRFDIGASTVEEAWSVYDAWAERGAANATADFKRRYAEYEEKMRNQILVPGAPMSGLVGPGGIPL